MAFMLAANGKVLEMSFQVGCVFEKGSNKGATSMPIAVLLAANRAQAR